MALISCPECGKQVSDRAPACPNCGCPINTAPVAAPQVDRSHEIAKYLDLAIKGIQGQNAQQVEQYCQAALEIDPYNYRAWELEARGILYGSTLAKNKVYQAISAAANAVEYAPDRKGELAESLYNSIYGHITGLLNIALINMPTMYAPQYVAQCMGYYGELLAGIPYLPRQRIDAELYKFAAMDEESKKAIMPRKRMIYASHALKPAWHEQYWAMLQQRGRV
jgi:hypothetical protein